MRRRNWTKSALTWVVAGLPLVVCSIVLADSCKKIPNTQACPTPTTVTQCATNMPCIASKQQDKYNNNFGCQTGGEHRECNDGTSPDNLYKCYDEYDCTLDESENCVKDANTKTIHYAIGKVAGNC